jgi:hypothetical protein
MMAAPKLDMSQARPSGQKDRKARETEAQDAVTSRGRERRKLGRTEQVAFRTFPRHAELLHDVAERLTEKEGRTITYVEVFEKALECLDAQTKESEQH